MIRFIVKRLAAGFVLLLVISLLIFVGCEMLPGDVAQIMLGQSASPENVAALRAELGLDRPAPVRYLAWLWGTFHGDWGVSMTSRQPVSVMLSERLSNTLTLAGLTTLVSVPLALLIGMVLAVHKGTRLDRVGTIVIVGLCATPEFLVATLGVLVFSIHLRWLPAISYVTPGTGVLTQIKSMLLPLATMTIIVTAQLARMTRAVVGNILTQPYVETARLKGAGPVRVIMVHALRNAVGPLINIIAMNVAYLISGVVIVETIFAFPGLARLMADSVQARDLPVVQACAMIFSASYIGLIMVADIVAKLFDSRKEPGAPS
ncbi:peptide/nickel transport system permease protein [Azospirillum agricola]|uniref:ABC transporter permease n=1 Tax=Azospirillum agricola TaxID=1720247 RepID=UPI001AE71F8D|nr:ABC transporter permease subunit [Azospirillum agricola]MBP2229398.1 peptide/nickel transport system permease protein [Azospirillum agricola]